VVGREHIGKREVKGLELKESL